VLSQPLHLSCVEQMANDQLHAWQVGDSNASASGSACKLSPCLNVSCLVHDWSNAVSCMTRQLQCCARLNKTHEVLLLNGRDCACRSFCRRCTSLLMSVAWSWWMLQCSWAQILLTFKVWLLHHCWLCLFPDTAAMQSCNLVTLHSCDTATV